MLELNKLFEKDNKNMYILSFNSNFIIEGKQLQDYLGEIAICEEGVIINAAHAALLLWSNIEIAPELGRFIMIQSGETYSVELDKGYLNYNTIARVN